MVEEKPKQPMDALQQANHIRSGRAALKRRIERGEISAAAALDDPFVQTAEVRDLLISQRRWGTTRAHNLLASLRIPENKVIGTMTQRQRLALIAALNSQQPAAHQWPPQAGTSRQAIRPEPATV